MTRLELQSSCRSEYEMRARYACMRVQHAQRSPHGVRIQIPGPTHECQIHLVAQEHRQPDGSRCIFMSRITLPSPAWLFLEIKTSRACVTMSTSTLAHTANAQKSREKHRSTDIQFTHRQHRKEQRLYTRQISLAAAHAVAGGMAIRSAVAISSCRHTLCIVGSRHIQRWVPPEEVDRLEHEA